MNLTVTAKGQQFDRLGLMYLNDTEVFRTSTAEPTLDGIVWTYTKDMSALLSMFKQPQKIIFDIDNNIDQTYTGAYNATLSATYFSDDKAPEPADMVVPVSARNSSSDQPSAFMLPVTPAVNNLTLPQNIKKAYFTLSACGQTKEEFWWSNIPNSTVNTFFNTTLSGLASPWREVQLRIDDNLAGVAWPFPVIFTGGVVPGFWRPIAGIDAFDLKEDEIDITPFLPMIADGQNHKYEIRMAGINDDGKGNANVSETVGDNWVVTGKIFLWLDKENLTTTGSMTVQNTPDPEFKVISSTQKLSNGTNTTLSYSVLAQRNLVITSSIKTSDGEREVSWNQSLTYSNSGSFVDDGNTQLVTQITSGTHSSSEGYSRRYTYPLSANTTFIDDTANGGNVTISGKIDRSRDEQVLGRGALDTPVDALSSSSGSDPVSSYTGYSLSNRQNGTADLTQNPAKNISVAAGTTEQLYELKGQTLNVPEGSETVLDASDGKELYRQHVIENNGTVATNEMTPVMNAGFISNDVVGNPVLATQRFPTESVQAMLGRGPKTLQRRRRR